MSHNLNMYLNFKEIELQKKSQNLIILDYNLGKEKNRETSKKSCSWITKGKIGTNS